jgi:transcriptional regulator with XRE-family HTH domain
MNITSFNSVCAERLREERKRLGFTQQEMAELIGVRQEMSSKYERGQASPGGDALAAFAGIGGDVQYVLTGQRSSSPMTPEEKELLSGFRKMDLRGKVSMLGMIDVVGQTPAETAKPDKPSRFANTITGADAQIIQGGKKHTNISGNATVKISRKKKDAV